MATDMAKVLGESGRYVSQQAVKKLRKVWDICIIGASVISAIDGFLVCYFLLNLKSLKLASLLLMLAFVVVVWLCLRISGRKLDELEKERMAMRKGAAGENCVGITLGDFPEEFRVINDLATDNGNVDHVVVGPTGVFLLDTKNWRGVVSADGKGELLSNGKPTDKPVVGQFVGRLMGIKDTVRTLAPDLDPYFQAVFVFPSARVDANWGTTGKVHCIRDDQLFDYIVESKWGKKLKQDEVQRIAQAFLALAHMDTDFDASMGSAGQPNAARVRGQAAPFPTISTPSYARASRQPSPVFR